MANTNKPAAAWYLRTDIFMAVAVIATVLMLIIPLPGILLDILIAFDLMLGIVILLSVMYVKSATEITVFPSLLLLTTVFRLALNVSATRLILLKGPAFNVEIIKAFGNFVVGGNYVIGFIIFLILVAVQFIVITKGATRIAEVAARFQLDAMPGKQMSIEAELNSGLITQEEAMKKQIQLKQEAEFYGQMDGASKFVQGDVKVGLLITIINIVGGLIIGTVMRGESVTQALKTYTLLTIGDGLVAQIPALLISTATGMIVTRAVSDGSLGSDLAKQLTSQPKVIFIASGFLFILALMPGFPTLALMALSIGTAVVGYQLAKVKGEERDKVQLVEKQKEDEERRKPVSLKNLLQVDPLEVEIGYNLIPLVDTEHGGDLLERITMIRRQIALEFGLLVPPIRIRDNMRLPPEEYSILVKGVEVAKGRIKVDRYLAMDSTGQAEKIDGEETKEPAFNLPAIWITEKERDKAELSGYTVVDPPSIIATHLTEVIKVYGYEILGRQDVQQLLDNIKETNPVLVDEVLKVTPIGIIQKILQNLLKERISVRDMITILETMADYGDKVKNVDLLTEYVRASLKRQITRSFVSENNRISAITLDPSLESMLSESVQETTEGIVSGVAPEVITQVISNAREMIQKIKTNGNPVVFMTSPIIRTILHDILQKIIPNLVVLSFNEIEPKVIVENMGVLRLEQEQEQPQQQV
ncbi:MAG: flagellar biosynthesis protein FlhA [bacterium]|nr:flagellar biosynthesis protein FlhA [bacterium]